MYDEYLGDDARRLVRGYELPHRLGQRRERKQPKGLKEHQAVEAEHAEGEAEPEEGAVHGRRRPEGRVQVGEDTEPHEEELRHEEDGGDGGVGVAAGGVEEEHHLWV